jgi:DNA polymerase elongation subunit (family B)
MGELAKALKKADRRILILDIETSPNLAYIFDLWQQGVAPGNIREHGQVICWAAKWVGEPKVLFASDHGEGHHQSIETAYRLVDEADIIVTYNGVKFDMKHLRREFLLAGFPPPSPHKDVDLYRVVRERFKFASNKLDHIAHRLEIGEKVKHEGFALWKACMDGDEAAWRRMRRYNVHDVRLTEQLYERLLPWIHNHPHVRNADVQGNELTCNKCGSDDLVRSSTYTAQVHQYQAYRCRRCGGQVRAGHIKRIAQTVGVK